MGSFAGGILFERGFHVADQLRPLARYALLQFRRPLRAPGLDLLIGRIAIVFAGPFGLFLHFDHLDDFGYERGICGSARGVPHGKSGFGFGDGDDGAIDQPALLLQRLALAAQSEGEWDPPVEQGTDVAKGHADELERDDLLQPFQVAVPI